TYTQLLSTFSMFLRSHYPGALHSFPTRRSSDLAGVRTYLGVDNVHDLFMPLVDGDIWTECRMLMEATRCYDMDAVAEWASRRPIDRKSTRLNSSHVKISYAVFCLKK